MLAATEQQMFEAAHWCMRLSENNLDEGEWAAFEKWLEVDDNADHFQATAQGWQAVDEVGDQPRMIALRSEALAEYHKLNRDRWNWGGRLGRGIAAGLAAATLAIASVTGWIVYAPDSYETEIGERQVAMLEDGSRMTLDASTSVAVKMRSSGRMVELEQGRAKFDVAKDALRPFSVVAGGKTIVATGTSFSVELVGKEVRVILYEGQVEVHDAKTGISSNPKLASTEMVVMKPGTELVANTATATEKLVAQPAIDDTLSWESGMLVFDNEPLGVAVERVNRYSDRKIVLDDASLAELPVSGVFKAGDIEAFAEGIGRLHHLRTLQSTDKVYLDRS